MARLRDLLGFPGVRGQEQRLIANLMGYKFQDFPKLL